MRFPCFLFLILFLSTSVANAADTRGLRVVAKNPDTGAPEEVRLYSKSYAVIIGIDKYLNLPQDRQLSYAVRDAKGVEEVIRRLYRFDRIVTLYDGQATRDRIMRLLTAELPKEMGKDDALFIFWAGHGNQEKTDEGDLGYLIPHDGSSEGIYGNITMSQLRDDISRALPAKHIFYAFDACYSGLLTTRAIDPRVRRDLGYLKEITKERVRQVLTAGSRGQEVLDGGPKGHSVFTGRLIEILEQTGDYITANELQTIIREKVYGDARGRSFEQTPGFGILSGSGDFVFVPSLERKIADNRAELERMQKELAELKATEAAAQKEQDEHKGREADRQRKVVEIRLKTEEMKKQQLAEEVKKRAELEAKKQQDEQRLSTVRAELERKRLSSAAGGKLSTFESAVAEIKRLATQLGEIEKSMAQELAASRQQIKDRYDNGLQAINSQKDEFETEKEFKARISEERVSIVRQRDTELAGLDGRIAQETEPLRAELKRLLDKEYTVSADYIQVELGQYDPHRQAFSLTLKGVGAAVQVASAGEIKLPKEAAREFKKHHMNGLVRADVKVRLDEKGSPALASVGIIDDMNGQSYALRIHTAGGVVEKDPTCGMEFVFVKGGCFQMGDIFGDGNDSEKPVHEVCVDDFFIGKYEVTQEEWERVMGTNPSAFKNGPRYPVENVSWDDAQEFIGRLGKLSGRNYRLPTEGEWEYAARSGGKRERYPGFSDSGQLYRYANICDSNCEYDWKTKAQNDGYAKSSPVGSYRSNDLGLYDMSGNVWEWVSDWYRKDYYSGSPGKNPAGPDSGSGRVSRGGSWSNGPWNARTSYRYAEGPGNRRFNQGLRLSYPVW